MNNQPNEATGSILDVIKEQTTNLERIVTGSNVEELILEGLREFGTRERATREATITIRHADGLDFDKISNIINEEWSVARKLPPVIFWKDRDSTYAQFLDRATKDKFIELAKSKPALQTIANKIVPPDHNGSHLARKHVRITIPAVPESVEPEKVETTLREMASKHTTMTPIRAGKPYGQARRLRSLMTAVNSDGFRLLFRGLGGAIPHNDAKSKTRLFPKVACKPWSCRDCFFIGPNHQCQGKACAQCGNHGHSAKDCKSKTRFCTNCKKPGHRARDAHCPIYVREVVKEIKRMDIPLEFLESKSKRVELLKSLIYK